MTDFASTDLAPTDNQPHRPGPWDLPSSARHDGWTGELMAKFCQSLADTGIVEQACLAVGKAVSGAYALRQRDPLFAAAWATALDMARHRLADTLLARSIEGSVEKYYKDGELVGEKRLIDNKLGLAMLRRFDQMIAAGKPAPARAPIARTAEPKPFDWDLALDALRTKDPDMVATALAQLKGEVEEVEDPPIPDRELEEVEEVEDHPSIRFWQDEGKWWTDYPPPPGFTQFQLGQWGERAYKRECTPAESDLLDRDLELDLSERRAADEAERAAYFAELAAELDELQPQCEETA